MRFTGKDQASAEACDRLVAETAEGIKAAEPGTLVGWLTLQTGKGTSG